MCWQGGNKAAALMNRDRTKTGSAESRPQTPKPGPAHSFRPVNGAQSNIVVDAAAAQCSCSPPVTSLGGGWGGGGTLLGTITIVPQLSFRQPRVEFPPVRRGDSHTHGQVLKVDREGGGDDFHEVKHKRTELSMSRSQQYFVLLSS